LTGGSAHLKYNRFEDLPVGQSGIELVERVYRLTRTIRLARSGSTGLTPADAIRTCSMHRLNHRARFWDGTRD